VAESFEEMNWWQWRSVYMPGILEDFGIDWIFVEITNVCNMHCQFCPSDHIARKRQSMNSQLFEKIIDQLAALIPRHPIALHVIGEPLLHENVFHFIDYCASRNIRIYLFTNCTKIKENITEICKRDNIVALVLSIQTPTEKTYMLRGFNKPFQAYMQDIYESIDYIVMHEANKKIRVELHLAETKGLPFREWDVLTDQADGLKIIKEICRNIKHSDEEFPDIPENFVDLQEWDLWGYQVLPNIFLRIKHFGTFGAHTLPREVLERVEPIKCDMANNNICILSDGTITVCCLDTEGDLSLGNIQDIRIIDALKSKRRATIIEDASRAKICRKCKGVIKI
jgi:MoaA/NifB/PqqE/SkfB family radical SAM enzyme